MKELASAGGDLKPFLKWAGGKRRLVPKIKELLGQFQGAYFEPFLGAGAVLLAMPKDVDKIGNDINAELVNLWETVRDRPVELADTLSGFENSKDLYLQIRALDRLPFWPDEISPLARAARTLFLNKTCYNGLYRVNSKGEFNVPFGNYKNPALADEAHLLEVSSFLSSNPSGCGTTHFTNSDFEDVVGAAKAGDAVYFDPPYAPISETSSFVSYSKNGFNGTEQARLRNVAENLIRKGVRVVLSNSDTPAIRELYAKKRGFEISEIRVARPIAASASSRTDVGEVLIYGGPH